eukprot:gene6821-30793_t
MSFETLRVSASGPLAQGTSGERSSGVVQRKSASGLKSPFSLQEDQRKEGAVAVVEEHTRAPPSFTVMEEPTRAAPKKNSQKYEGNFGVIHNYGPTSIDGSGGFEDMVEFDLEPGSQTARHSNPHSSMANLIVAAMSNSSNASNASDLDSDEHCQLASPLNKQDLLCWPELVMRLPVSADSRGLADSKITEKHCDLLMRLSNINHKNLLNIKLVYPNLFEVCIGRGGETRSVFLTGVQPRRDRCHQAIASVMEYFHSISLREVLARRLIVEKHPPLDAEGPLSALNTNMELIRQPSPGTEDLISHGTLSPKEVLSHGPASPKGVLSHGPASPKGVLSHGPGSPKGVLSHGPGSPKGVLSHGPGSPKEVLSHGPVSPKGVLSHGLRLGVSGRRRGVGGWDPTGTTAS